MNNLKNVVNENRNVKKDENAKLKGKKTNNQQVFKQIIEKLTSFSKENENKGQVKSVKEDNIKDSIMSKGNINYINYELIVEKYILGKSKFLKNLTPDEIANKVKKKT